MDSFASLDEFDPRAGSAVAVGVFDGFHLGHRRVVETLVALARSLGARSCVLTFRSHPRAVLSGVPQDLVTSIEHRLVLLERAGVEAAVAVEFTREIASLTARRFVREVLKARLGARALVLGHDARIGAGDGAGALAAARLAEAEGLLARVVEPVLAGGYPVSSTRVRERIQAGDLAGAEALLGRRVSVMGTVVRGRGVGARLGFPTANLDLAREVRPPYGVYATWAILEGSRLPSVTNVGFRPTFLPPANGAHGEEREERGEHGGDEEGLPSRLSSSATSASSAANVRAPCLRADRLVETHLLVPPGKDLAGVRMEVEFVRKLRDEARFGTDAELASQIARDAEAARKVLDEDARAG